MLTIYRKDEWQDSIGNLKFHIATLTGESLRTSHNGKSPIDLRIGILDPQAVPVFKDAQLVTLDVLGTVDQPEILSKGEKATLRQPAVCDLQFDVIARDQIWSRQLGNKKVKATVEEVIAYLYNDI